MVKTENCGIFQWKKKSVSVRFCAKADVKSKAVQEIVQVWTVASMVGVCWKIGKIVMSILVFSKIWLQKLIFAQLFGEKKSNFSSCGPKKDGMNDPVDEQRIISS